MMNRNLRKAILAGLGVTALAGISTQVGATAITADLTSSVNNAAGYNTAALPAYVWDGGNIGYGSLGKGDCTTNTCANLPADGLARVQGANSAGGTVQGDRLMGWNHTTKWYTFQIATAGGYTISMDRPTGASANNQPAFSIWSSGANPWGAGGSSHRFNQVTGPSASNSNAYMQDGANPITGFVGYANSGPGFTNGDGNTVLGAMTSGTSTQGPLLNPANAYNATTNPYTSTVTKGTYTNSNAGLIAAAFAGGGSSVNTSNGHADLQLWLPAGWYVMTGGGSCADFTCSPTSVTTNPYNIKILSNSAITAPVPVPAAVWLFGSALAGMGIIGRRKATLAA